MPYTLYICGYKDTDLTSDEVNLLDTNKDKWKDNWNIEKYCPEDKRDSDFENVYKTFEGEGKRIVIYQEITIDKEKDITRFNQAYDDLKSSLKNVKFELHDDNGRVK